MHDDPEPKSISLKLQETVDRIPFLGMVGYGYERFSMTENFTDPRGRSLR